MALYRATSSRGQSGGHWVTIKDGRWKGQHVFIKDGQTFEQALEDRKKHSSGLEDRPVANKLAKQKQNNFYNKLNDNDKKKYDDYKSKGYSDSDIQNTLMYKTQEEKMRDNGIKLNDRQIAEGNRLASKAENGVRDDIKTFLSGKEDYDGSQEEFIKDLSDEWGVDKEKVEDILHEESSKHPRLFKNERQNSADSNKPSASSIVEEFEYFDYGDWNNSNQAQRDRIAADAIKDIESKFGKGVLEDAKLRKQVIDELEDKNYHTVANQISMKYGDWKPENSETLPTNWKTQHDYWKDEESYKKLDDMLEARAKSLTGKEQREAYEDQIYARQRWDRVKASKEKETRTPGYENEDRSYAGWELYSDDPNRFGDMRAYNEKMQNWNGSESKYSTTKHEGFGNYNDDYIPVYNNKIDNTGDFSRADLSKLNDNELSEALRVQKEELSKAQGESVGDRRTRNGRMDKIFKDAKVNKYSQGVEKLQSEIDNRSGANWREQIKANNDQLEKNLENYKNTHDMRYESEGYYELFRENERKNAKIKREEPNEKYEFVEAYAGYKAKRDKLENITRNEDGSRNWDNYKEATWTGKEYTNDEFLENLEDENWHTERKMLLDAGLTNKQMEFVKNNTTFRNGSPSLDREITEELIKGAKGQKYRTPEQIKTDRTNKETNELTTALRHMERYGKDNSDVFKNYKYSSYDEMTNRYKQLTGKDFEKGKVNVPYDPKKTYTLKDGTPINQDLMKQWYDGRKRTEVEGSIKVDKDMIMSATPENREMYNALVKETEKYLKGIPTTKSRISDEYTTHDWAEGYGSHYGEPSWKGSKSDSGLYGKDKIKAIDDVIKKAYPEIKTGRRTHQSGYTDSFSYTVKGSTQPMVRKFEDFSDSEIENIWNSGNNKSWYKTKEDFTNQLKNELSQKSLNINEYNIDDDYRLTPYAKQLFKDISRVSDSYNYDESDSQSDYFHTGHYISYHLENNPLLEDKKSSKSKAMNLSQLVQSYVDRGYSEETARKMAQKAVNKRKRK